MALWESKMVADIVSQISDNQIVLPVIQRRLVWEEEKMEMLFDTLLKGNSFGGIMVIYEEKGDAPLFATRFFSKDGTDTQSIMSFERLMNPQSCVIDGQQRLQSFFIGLCGSISGKILYFNLAGNWKGMEYDFRFSSDVTKLPKRTKDNGSDRQNIWFPVCSLYSRLRLTRDYRQVTDEICKDLEIETDKDCIKENISIFYDHVFSSPSIGIAKVAVNRSLNELANRQRIVQLFKRLNDGGTRLSSYDLIASILKGFDWRMEQFLDDLKIYQSIGLGQDEIIKLIFILQDNPIKEMVNLDAKDADFAIKYKERILSAIIALEKFLRISKLYDYYHDGNRSAIPLYFIIYNLFHQDIDNMSLQNVFDKFDVKSDLYRNIFRWTFWSLMNGVFKSRGAGWTPTTTGVRKIMEVVKDSKSDEFPTDKVFEIYSTYPLNFFKTILDVNDLDNLDSAFLLYVMYDRQRPVRQQDVDHIHPRNILEKAGIEPEKINSIRNLQLLDVGTNRGEKNGKPLAEWINKHVDDKKRYASIHSIPSEERLWNAVNFDGFASERAKLILAKVNMTATA